jgi:hypothetical protein
MGEPDVRIDGSKYKGIIVHLLMIHQACQWKEKGTHLIMRLHHDHGNQNYSKKQLYLANTRSIWQKKKPTLVIET